MVAESMALQDDSGSTDSETTLPMAMGNIMTLDMEVSSAKSMQLTEQFHSGVEDHAHKVRKPYTITKQRERWTEDEHKKFLEALKLYGRAWRRIEEHVGTKTAVQIRSHAQKFFSKVVRESNDGDSGSVKQIEIPPPRPKRKPLHPYPRKLSASAKSGALALDKPSRAANICSPAEPSQSPTSVLSAFGSDAPGATESNTPEGSQSPVSSVMGGSSGFVLSEPPNSSPPKTNASSSSSQANNCSNQDGKIPLKLELFPEDNCFVKEGSEEVSSTQCLKLFGKTVMVTDSCRPASPAPATGKTQAFNDSDGKLAQAVPWNFIPMKYTQGDLEYSWGAHPSGLQATLFCLPLGGQISNATETNSPPSGQWWTYQGGKSFVQIHSPIPIKASCFADTREELDREIRKDGSSSDSNAECESMEAESCHFSLALEGRAQAASKPRETSFLELRTGSGKCTKGFVPYKRCLAERDAGSVVKSEEREEQRIRLCL